MRRCLVASLLAAPPLVVTNAEPYSGLRAPSPCVVPHATNENYTLEGSLLHYRLSLFLRGDGPAPLEEVFFATHNLTKATQDALIRECPGLLVTSYVVLAEARLLVSREQAAGALVKANWVLSHLNEEGLRDQQELWPIELALARYHKAEAGLVANVGGSGLALLHVVVCHCRESLGWLADEARMYVPRANGVSTHLFVYEKCGVPEPENVESLHGAFHKVTIHQVEDGDVRRDECSGYLRHLIAHYADPPDFAAFFQADAGDHLQWGYLALVMRGVEQRALQTKFVHLSYPRLVASLSPCRAEVFSQLFGRGPHGMLGSYCCAQFLVSREAWLSNALEVYQRMEDLLFGSSPDECHDIPGHSTQCLMFEVYWHVLFGRPDELPERAEDEELPLMLRTRDLENESYLPPGSLFLQLLLDV